MTVNNWVYLPDSRCYINLNHIIKVEYLYDAKYSVLFSDGTETWYEGNDATALTTGIERSFG